MLVTGEGRVGEGDASHGSDSQPPGAAASVTLLYFQVGEEGHFALVKDTPARSEMGAALPIVGKRLEHAVLPHDLGEDPRSSEHPQVVRPAGKIPMTLAHRRSRRERRADGGKVLPRRSDHLRTLRRPIVNHSTREGRPYKDQCQSRCRRGGGEDECRGKITSSVNANETKKNRKEAKRRLQSSADGRFQ